ncbi:hypothetical protein [Rugosimonospora africana]|uniref:Adhesin domain-containing protein n=1 Tax=Rugosimonospora africana TaxID=556532 RepID=A0A8J3QLW6_9ACTN|nr:hypothetical protein [Rugosimonospora africana]GIH12110.1 hypothetical protein Raf01_02820 [Rugosimonospora africana]
MAVDTSAPPEGPVAAPDCRPIYIGLVILVALLLIALLVAAVSLTVRHGNGPEHTVSAPLAGRDDARLDLTSGVGLVTVRVRDLGDRLYRIGTPAGSGTVPRVTDQDGSVLVGLGASDDGSGGGPASVEILLSSRATWRFRLAGGADEARLDLRGGPVSGVDIASGVSSVELWLPRPRGTVTVREGGGASEFTVHAPAAVPVQVRVAGGAGQATIDGTVHAGVSGNTVYPAAGWDQARDRYELDAVGGLSQLSLDRS